MQQILPPKILISLTQKGVLSDNKDILNNPVFQMGRGHEQTVCKKKKEKKRKQCSIHGKRRLTLLVAKKKRGADLRKQ